MDASVNPYKVLEVSKNFTLEELKSNYKRIALKVHPEKGGNEYMFNLVTECFKKLMREYKKRFSMPPRPHVENIGGPGFNLDKFNMLFEQNRLDDVYDKGYEDWYKKEAVGELPKFKGKTPEAFNQHFEKHVQGNAVAAQTVEEPEAFWGSKLEWTELGAQTVKDFSGDNNTLKRLNFSDLKLAHSTTRIVDPTTVSRKEYHTVDELKRDRGTISFTMNHEEEKRLNKREKEQHNLERKRQEYLAKKDLITENHYNRIHGVMQGALR